MTFRCATHGRSECFPERLLPPLEGFRQRRLKARRQIQAVAKAVGISPAYLSQFERGQFKLSQDKVEKLDQVLTGFEGQLSKEPEG